MRRRRQLGLVFAGLWLVVWIAAIMLAVVGLAGAVRAGEYGAAPILVIWLAAAGFGLWRVGRSFAARLTGARLVPQGRRRVRHAWMDRVSGPASEVADGRAPSRADRASGADQAGAATPPAGRSPDRRKT